LLIRAVLYAGVSTSVGQGPIVQRREWRDYDGQFEESDDVGKSIADRLKKAKTKVKSGQATGPTASQVAERLGRVADPKVLVEA
jgi:hypothetical protein